MRQSVVGLLLALSAPWVVAQPLELRTAIRDSEPISWIRNGQANGVCPNIFAALQRVDKDLSISGVQRLLSFPLIERALAEGKLDITCGFAKNPERVTYLRYLDKVMSSRMVVAVRADDPITDIKDIQELVRLSQNGNPIIVRRGTVFVERLEKLGALIDSESTDNKVNMIKLINRRGRFYYNIDYLLAAQAKEEPGVGKIRILPTSLDTEPLYIVVSKRLPVSVDKRIQAAMAELRRTGELQQILTNHGLPPVKAP